MASALKLPPPHTDTPNALLAQEGVFPVPPGKYREIPLSLGGIYLSARSPLRIPVYSVMGHFVFFMGTRSFVMGHLPISDTASQQCFLWIHSAHEPKAYRGGTMVHRILVSDP